MTREMLRPKRCALRVDLNCMVGGNIERISVSYGFNDGGRVAECFCMAFKAGTDLQTLLHHACIAISVGLQHGMTMAELARVLGEDDGKPPRSILGAIVRQGMRIDSEMAEALG